MSVNVARRPYTLPLKGSGIMNTVNLLLSQMVNTAEGEKFKIGENGQMDVYDFKKFIASSCKDGKLNLSQSAPTENTTAKKRKCVILVLKRKAKN